VKRAARIGYSNPKRSATGLTDLQTLAMFGRTQSVIKANLVHFTAD